MDKKSLLALVIIGIILFTFTWFQSKQARDRQEEILKQQQLEALTDIALDSMKTLQDSVALDKAQRQESAPSRDAHSEGASRYADSCLRSAFSAPDEAPLRTPVLKNSKLELVMSSKGAHFLTANVKQYKAYGQDSLFLIKNGSSEFDISVNLVKGLINTKDFDFTLVESSDSVAVFRLYFENGSYIQQKYVLPEDSYMVHNELSIHGAKEIVPSSTRKLNINWKLDIPRLEKGFKNEKQYSKLDVLCMDENDPEVFSNDKHKSYQTGVYWFDFNQQFFSVIMTAENGFAGGEFDIKFADENDADNRLMTCRAENVRVSIDGREADQVFDFDYYLGPNDYRILRSYDRNYDKVVTIGGKVIGLLTRFIIIPCFEFLNRFISNYGLIILLLTVLLKLVLAPLTSKSYRSSAAMTALKPEIDKLNEKFPKAMEDKQQALKKQQATMDLYKRAGVKPLGGCLPMLLQLPILWAMFRFFPASIQLRQQSFLWADDLSAYDSILDFPVSILGMDHLSLFALLMAASMFFYSKFTMPQSDDPQMKPMRFMSVWMMPIMMFFICNGLSSALSYYYLLSNIFTMIQTFIIRKWVVKPEKVLARLEANKNKPVQKSKWQIRLEEAQKAAQAQQNARRR